MRAFIILCVASCAVALVSCRPDRATTTLNQIFVKTLSGNSITIDVGPNDTVAMVKSKIEAKVSIPAGILRLLFAGCQLQDERSLASYAIETGATLNLALRLRGGEFKLQEAGIDVSQLADMTVGSVKSIVAQKLGHISDHIYLTMDGKVLDDNSKISDLSLTPNSNIDFQLKENIDETSQKGDKYFGVDANDKDAVRHRQRELGEEKFRELFGADVEFEMDQDHHHREEEKSAIDSLLKWVYGTIKGHLSGFTSAPKDASTTSRPSD